MRPERTQVFAQGLVAGLIGYAMVAVLFAIANVMLGRSPFYTAALLGEATFYGLRDPAAVTIWPGPILAYNGLHLVVFLALGLLASWLACLAEKGPELWYVATVLFIFVMFHMYGAFLLLTEGMRHAISAWLVMVAGIGAGGAMGAYLLGAHPQLRAGMRESAA